MSHRRLLLVLLSILVAIQLFRSTSNTQIYSKDQVIIATTTAFQSIAISPPTSLLLIMSDSRLLEVDDYHRLAYSINSHYAKLHGYKIRFVHTPCLQTTTTDNEDSKQCIACIHKDYGGRMSPWCKVLSINDTLHRYSSSIFDCIVFIDSDAFVNRLDEPLHTHSEYFVKTLNMFANEHEQTPCSGIQLWHNTEQARQMIQAWWDSDTNYNVRHDYEQSVFHTKSLLKQQYIDDIGIVREPVREFSRKNTKGFFRHITYKKEGARYKRMKAFMMQHNISVTSVSTQEASLVL